MNTRTTAATVAVALVVLLVPCALSGADDPPAPEPAPSTALNAEEAKKTWEWMMQDYLYSGDYQKSPRYESCGVLFNHLVALVDYELTYKLSDAYAMGDSAQINAANAADGKTWEFDVRENPDPSSARFGRIVIRLENPVNPDGTDSYAPWIRATYVPEGGSPPVEFEPDLVQSDFGYTGYFHHTFIERSGAWFKLPKNPLPKPGWVNLSIYKPFPHVLSFNRGDICRLGKDKLLILIDAHPAGITCQTLLSEEVESPPPIVPENVIMIPYSELYDADGHFCLRPACLKEC